ncbi:MAG: hypothetical protein HY827_04245 [Actinobacteria bacterium]|nr:hypothetical protein [Actinomycetota bacterium]
MIATGGATALSADYNMELNFAPDVNDWLDRSDIGECNPDDSGAFVCVLEGPWTDLGAPLRGSVTDPATGATGALEAICSIDGYAAVSFSIAPPPDDSLAPVVDLVDAGGKVRVDCAWRLRMNDAQQSLLVGRALMNTYMTAADPASALVQLNDSVTFDVAAGTGIYAGLTGYGITDAQTAFPMLGSSGELPIDFELVSMGARSNGVRAAAAPADGKVGFNLRASNDRLHISAPLRVSRRDLSGSLIGETAPGSKCTFKARGGSRRVNLGRARADAGGFVKLNRSRAAKLDAGRWTITGTCKTRSGVVRAATKLTLEK